MKKGIHKCEHPTSQIECIIFSDSLQGGIFMSLKKLSNFNIFVEKMILKYGENVAFKDLKVGDYIEYCS